MARPKLSLSLSTEQRSELKRLVNAPSTPQRIVRRARIALLAADGKDNHAIAAELHTSHVTVGLWRQRVFDLGLAGLDEASRPGRPSLLQPAQVNKALTDVVRPPKGRERWSCRTMARHSGLSHSAVQRLWAANDLKPHLTRAFKLSNVPRFEANFWDIIGLYLDPPVRAVILCCDGKSQCQAPECSRPGLPLGQGHFVTRTHNCFQHGTITLFAALNYVNGKVLAERASRHRSQEWLKFLQKIEKDCPPDVHLHLILDNYPTHKHPKVSRWLAKRPRFHLHFTPTNASWVNLVERFFRDLSQDVVLPGSFESVKELVQAIWDYLAERNLKTRQYEWRAQRQGILEKLQRTRKALAQRGTITKDYSETPQ